MNNIEFEIKELVNKVYQDKSYPDLADIVIEENIAREISEDISRACNTNSEFKECNDCDYCFQIAISESKKTPILPDYKKKDNRRKLWIKTYGRSNYQMYIALSKLGKYALIYWSKYSYVIFSEKINHRYTIPDNNWTKLYDCIKLILGKKHIEIVNNDLSIKTLNIKYKGKIEGIDNKPSLKKLLFTEELH